MGFRTSAKELWQEMLGVLDWLSNRYGWLNFLVLVLAILGIGFYSWLAPESWIPIPTQTVEIPGPDGEVVGTEEVGAPRYLIGSLIGLGLAVVWIFVAGSKLNMRRHREVIELRTEADRHDQALPTPEAQTHRFDLISLLGDLRGTVTAATPMTEEFWQWLIAAEDHWPVPGGQVLGSPSRPTVTLTVEADVRWPRLMQHLEDDDVWESIEDWRRSVQGDLRARYDLLLMIETGIRQGLPELPVSRDISNDAGGTPHVHPYYALEVLRRAFREDAWRLAESDIKRPEPTRVEYSGRLLALTNNEEQTDRAVALIVELTFEIRMSPEAKAARGAHKNSAAAADRLRVELDRVIHTTRFPPGRCCDFCAPVALRTG